MTLRIHPAEIVRQSQSPLLAAHSSWARVPLGEVAEVRNGFAFSSGFFSKTQGMPLLRIRDVGADSTQARYSGQYDPAYVVRSGEIVVGMDGDFRVARWRGPKALLNQRVCKITVRDDSLYDENFLLHVLPGYLSAIHDHTSSVTVKHLSSESVKEIPLPLPPLAEQRRIVAAIEEQFSRIDAGVEALQRARRNLQRIRAAVLQAAVTGRLVPQNPDDEPAARFPAEASREAGPYSLPAGWLWARIEEVAEVQGGIQKQPKRRPGKNAYPFLRVANVLRSELDLTEVHMIELFAGELDRYRLRPGDLLVVEGNGSLDQIGRSALWQGAIDPCVHQNHLIRVRPGPALSPNYLNVFWNAPPTAAAIQAVASSTSGLYTLSTAKVRRVLVAVPPISEQERINLEVSRQLSLIDAARQAVDEVSGRARSLKTTTLGHAFAGRLVPHDSSDEPARVLLDRIMASHAADELAAIRPRRRAQR